MMVFYLKITEGLRCLKSYTDKEGRHGFRISETSGVCAFEIQLKFKGYAPKFGEKLIYTTYGGEYPTTCNFELLKYKYEDKLDEILSTNPNATFELQCYCTFDLCNAYPEKVRRRDYYETPFEMSVLNRFFDGIEQGWIESVTKEELSNALLASRSTTAKVEEPEHGTQQLSDGTATDSDSVEDRDTLFIISIGAAAFLVCIAILVIIQVRNSRHKKHLRETWEKRVQEAAKDLDAQMKEKKLPEGSKERGSKEAQEGGKLGSQEMANKIPMGSAERIGSKERLRPKERISKGKGSKECMHRKARGPEEDMYVRQFGIPLRPVNELTPMKPAEVGRIGSRDRVERVVAQEKIWRQDPNDPRQF